ncbi:GNAT family N-acetyltransferase [Streptomyces sp. NPDC058374]|uniref:GNAT family N-acetyltransferase n=1 Tax=Streptomyces sp. NPDC058374 TaxID=3346466 RepID=UPI0036696715
MHSRPTETAAPATLPDARGIRLRFWEPSDAPAVLGAFATAEMARQSGRPVTTLDEAATWITERRTAREAGREYSFAVLALGTPAAAKGGGDLGHPPAPEGRLLGSVTVGAVDPVHQTGWISYWTLASARGRGVATTGLLGLADWAFTELGLFRLELGHRTNNPASCTVARRAGFAVEGLERARLRYGDQRYDVERHARLATDGVEEGGAEGSAGPD